MGGLHKRHHAHAMGGFTRDVIRETLPSYSSPPYQMTTRPFVSFLSYKVADLHLPLSLHFMCVCISVVLSCVCVWMCVQSLVFTMFNSKLPQSELCCDMCSPASAFCHTSLDLHVFCFAFTSSENTSCSSPSSWMSSLSLSSSSSSEPSLEWLPESEPALCRVLALVVRLRNPSLPCASLTMVGSRVGVYNVGWSWSYCKDAMWS